MGTKGAELSKGQLLKFNKTLFYTLFIKNAPTNVKAELIL